MAIDWLETRPDHCRPDPSNKWEWMAHITSIMITAVVIYLLPVIWLAVEANVLPVEEMSICKRF